MAHDFKDHTASENGEFISETREKLFPHDSKPLLPNQEAFMVMLCFDGRHDLAYQNLHNWSLGIESTHESYLSQKGNDNFIKFTYDMSNIEATSRGEFKDLEAAIINKNELTDIQAAAYKEIMQAGRFDVGDYCKKQWLTNQYAVETAFNHTDTAIIDKAIEAGNNEVDRKLSAAVSDTPLPFPPLKDWHQTENTAFVTIGDMTYMSIKTAGGDLSTLSVVTKEGRSNIYADNDPEKGWFKSTTEMFNAAKDHYNSSIQGVPISPDTDLLAKLEELFPEELQDQDGEVTIDLIPPNGKDFYERMSIRPINPDDSDLLPPNSFTIKHFTASPATIGIGDPQHIKHEFTFSVKDNKIKPYWMQDGAIYHDAMSHKSNGIYKSPEAMKEELNTFVTGMLKRARFVPKADVNDNDNPYLSQTPIDRGLVGAYEKGKKAGQDGNTVNPYVDRLNKDCPDPKAYAKAWKEGMASRLPQFIFPALSPAEKQELANFTNAIQKDYPAASTENLHKLCNIASDMGKLTIQNEKGTLSNEKFNALTDHKEKQINDILKDIPGAKANGVKAQFHYATETRTVLILFPQGSSYTSFSVPEIPKNKLTLPQEPKAATETISHKR